MNIEMLKGLNIRKLAVVVVVTAAGLLATPIGYAGNETPVPGNVIEETKNSFMTGDMGVTFVSEYIPRGVVAENQGVIAQPYFNLRLKLYEGTGFINSITGQLGAIGSIQSHIQPFAGKNPTSHWFEFTPKPAVLVGLGKKFLLTVEYIDAMSPAEAFHTAYSLNVILEYKDTDLFFGHPLHPHLTVLRELPAPGQVSLGPNGWYYELGISPTYVIAPQQKYPVTCIASLGTGLGSHHFYAGNAFGYASGGLSAAIPLGFIPPGYGLWTFTTGYNYYYLGTNLAKMTATGHHNQHVFSSAIGMTF